ncbi:hypothetical protein DFH11DRAFT_1517959, partial [Phellopilus nigrolimitatus]
TCFHPHISIVFNKLLIPLCDHRLIVHDVVADLLAACLDIITQRETDIRDLWNRCNIK